MAMIEVDMPEAMALAQGHKALMASQSYFDAQVEREALDRAGHACMMFGLSIKQHSFFGPEPFIITEAIDGLEQALRLLRRIAP